MCVHFRLGILIGDRFSASLQQVLLIVRSWYGPSPWPGAQKAGHLERGDGYFSRQQYREAVIKYRNVLQLEGTNTPAIRQLGLAHYELDELGHAVRYLVRSQELEPAHTAVSLEPGTIYLFGRQPEKARESEWS